MIFLILNTGLILSQTPSSDTTEICDTCPVTVHGKFIKNSLILAKKVELDQNIIDQQNSKIQLLTDIGDSCLSAYNECKQSVDFYKNAYLIEKNKPERVIQVAKTDWLVVGGVSIGLAILTATVTYYVVK